MDKGHASVGVLQVQVQGGAGLKSCMPGASLLFFILVSVITSHYPASGYCCDRLSCFSSYCSRLADGPERTRLTHDPWASGHPCNPTPVPCVCFTLHNALPRHSFGFLGSWKVTARGGWRDNGGGLCAQAWFESFGVRPDGHILGFNASSLPEVVLPVPAQFQTLTDWCTTYLDGDTRVSRGAGGLIFLFKKKAVPAGALPRGQSPITVYPWPSPTPPPTSPAPV